VIRFRHDSNQKVMNWIKLAWTSRTKTRE